MISIAIRVSLDSHPLIASVKTTDHTTRFSYRHFRQWATLLGKRDAGCAAEFMQDLANRLANRVQLTADGLKVYLSAVIDVFADDTDRAVLHKIYGAEPSNEARYSPYPMHWL